MRFLRGASAVLGRPPSLEDERVRSDEDPEPAEITIHIRFQSVWPDTRMRTHPSMRPRSKADRVSLPKFYISI